MSFNSSIAYVKFDNLVCQVKTSIKQKLPAFLGYSSDVVASRVIQKIVEISLFEYVKYCQKNYETSSSLSKNETINIANLKFVLKKSPEVKVTLKLVLASVTEFWIHWMHVFVVSTFAFFRLNLLKSYFMGTAKQHAGPSTLLFGVGKEVFSSSEGDKNFVDYCFQGDVLPLKSANHILVQSTDTISSSSELITYTRFPLHTLMQRNPMGFISSLKFLSEHIALIFIYFTVIIKQPILSILGRDFAYQSMINSLNTRNLIQSVVITNSNYSAQPLWMRENMNKSFNVHMVWYSQNIIPLTYASDKIKSAIPNYRHLHADEHWLWTESFSEYLKELGLKGIMNVISPIMWYLPTISTPHSDNELQVTVFDITPIDNDFAERIGIYRNYYSVKNCTDFINTIVDVCKKICEENAISININLKHKREYYTGHSKAYIDLIKQLCNSNNIRLIDPKSNIFKLIASSDLVIVMPYSSPANVAAYLQKPAVYFDVNNELIADNTQLNQAEYISEKHNLYNYILKLTNEISKSTKRLS